MHACSGALRLATHGKDVCAHGFCFDLLKEHLLNMLFVVHFVPNAKAPEVACAVIPITALQRLRSGHDSFSGIFWGSNERLAVVHFQHSPKVFAYRPLSRVECVVRHVRHLQQHRAAAKKIKPKIRRKPSPQNEENWRKADTSRTVGTRTACALSPEEVSPLNSPPETPGSKSPINMFFRRMNPKL